MIALNRMGPCDDILVVDPDGTLAAADLASDEEFVSFLKQERSRGRRIVLATEADRSAARAMAEAIGVFDDVLASDPTRRLTGRAKLEAIEAYCRAVGAKGFAYLGGPLAGTTVRDRAIRMNTAEPLTAGPDSPRREPRSRVFGRGWPAATIRAIRPHQWLKNLLLFVPLLVGHQAGDLGKVLVCLVAFVSLSAVASAVYVINDLLDVPADRCHPTKRNRPFASGVLPLSVGPPLALGLLLLGFGLAFALLPVVFGGILAAYLVLTTSYSCWLKRKVLVDVLVLAGLYTLRIVAGGMVTGIAVSEWLMAFSMFLFLSLAFAKRYSELSRLADTDGTAPEGRGYMVGDLSLIEVMGPMSGYLAVLVFALYINSPTVRSLYAEPWALWLVAALLLYWISRVWFQAKRRQLNEDPVVFALTDRVSLGVGVLVAGLAILAV